MFFVFSTKRWDKLTSVLKITLKGHSDTRWCSKERAVTAFCSQIEDLIALLQNISEDISYGDGVA